MKTNVDYWSQRVKSLNKATFIILITLSFSCADIQDVMPGMSYSDRTLSKGIRESVEISLRASFNSLAQSEEVFANRLLKELEEKNSSFMKTMSRLNKEKELKRIFHETDLEIKNFFTNEYKIFVELISEVQLTDDPEDLMLASMSAISHHYAEQLNWKEQIALRLNKDNSFIVLNSEFNALIKLYNDIPYLDEKVNYQYFKEVSAIMSYVLIREMIFNEHEMRRNPLLRTSPDLKKTFGDYDPI